MKLILVPSSQGSLDKNLGCETAPELLCKNKETEKVNVVPSNLEETDKAIYSKAKEVFQKRNRTFYWRRPLHNILFIQSISEEFQMLL